MLIKRACWSYGIPIIVALCSPVLASESSEESISIFSGNLGNAIWTLLVFMLVVFILGKFAWKPILTGLQKRENFIRDSIESARQDREAAEARLREYEERLQNAQKDASAIIDEGRQKAEAVKQQIENDTRKNAEEMIERAKREIDLARNTALRDLYDKASHIAMDMASNVLKRQLTPEDHQALIREALSEIRSNSESRN